MKKVRGQGALYNTFFYLKVFMEILFLNTYRHEKKYKKAALKSFPLNVYVFNVSDKLGLLEALKLAKAMLLLTLAY